MHDDARPPVGAHDGTEGPWSSRSSTAPDAEDSPPDERGLNAVTLCLMQGAFFLLIFAALLAFGIGLGKALLAAWLGSVPVLLGVLAITTLQRVGATASRDRGDR